MHNLMKCVAVCSALTLSPLAVAKNIAPGGNFFGGDTTVIDSPQLAGDIVRDALIPFSFETWDHQTVSGLLQDRVVHSIDGTYDFYSRIILDGNSAAFSVYRVDRTGFAGYATNVGSRSDSIGEYAPSEFSRDLSGSTIDFNFNMAPLTAGQSTKFFFIDTNASSYNLSGRFTDNSNLNFVGIAAPVPEPETYAMLLAGLGLLGLAARRRRARQG